MPTWIRNALGGGKSKPLNFTDSNRFRHVTSRLAHVCWQINALERWLDLSPTAFALRDRVTQAEYTLDTQPAAWTPTGDWYSSANLNALLDLVGQQFRTGGPSGLGAHRWYVHSLLVTQARTALIAIQSALWGDPPAGPGLGGMLFGARWMVQNQLGERVTVPNNTLLSGGKYPQVIATLPPDPTSDRPGDSTLWDYADGTAAPVPSHYLTDPNRLRPDEVQSPDTYEGWNTGKFEKLKYRLGTTSNSSIWPPDLQVLSEFNLDPGRVPIASISVHPLLLPEFDVNVPLHVWPGLSYIDAFTKHYLPTTVRLIPPSGTSSNLSRDRWGARTGQYDDPTTDYTQIPRTVQKLLRASLWSHGIQGWSGQMTATTTAGFETVINGPRAAYHTRGRSRIGFESDIQGAPWQRNVYEWVCHKLGAVPDELRLRGTFSGSLWVDLMWTHGVPPSLFPSGIDEKVKFELVIGPCGDDASEAKAALAGGASGSVIATIELKITQPPREFWSPPVFADYPCPSSPNFQKIEGGSIPTDSEMVEVDVDAKPILSVLFPIGLGIITSVPFAKQQYTFAKHIRCSQGVNVTVTLTGGWETRNGAGASLRLEALFGSQVVVFGG